MRRQTSPGILAAAWGGRADPAGFALPATILALIMVGALVTGGVFLAGQESQIASSGDYSAEAFLAAERGLAEAIGSLRPSDYYGVDGDTVFTLTASSGGLETVQTIRIRAVTHSLYFVESTGRVTGGGARNAGATHRTAALVRPISADFDVQSALTTLGSVDVGGGGYVSGHDHTPTGDGFDCPSPGGSKSGILSSDESTTSGSGDVAGDPPMQVDETLTAEDFLVFGNITYDDLVALASHTVGSGNLFPAATTNGDGSCNTTDSNNWGAQSGACSDYFPIIHVAGSGENSVLKEYGQGILLVDGNYKANGGGRFNGIVIVRGQLIHGNGNGGVTGGILVYNNGSLTDQYNVNGNGVALYSRCAIETAVENNDALNRIIPIQERSWMDMTATGELTY